MIAETQNSPLRENREVDLDAIETVRSSIAQLPPVEGEVENTFTPGIMTRRWFGRAGCRYLSKIHKSRHQFVILQGAALVRHNGGPWIQMVAPYHGITEPGTWRELFVLMDTVWLTMHPTDKTTVEEVEKDIIQSTEIEK